MNTKDVENCLHLLRERKAVSLDLQHFEEAKGFGDAITIIQQFLEGGDSHVRATAGLDAPVIPSEPASRAVAVPVSNCCHARMHVAGGKDGTQWAVCDKCGEPCDALGDGEVPTPLTREEEKQVTADFYDDQVKKNPVPAPSVSAEAMETGKMVAMTSESEAWCGKIVQLAIDAATAALRAELSLLHESHDTLAKEVEGLRKIRTLSGELLMLAKSWALVWSDRLSPESLRTFKDLEVELLAAMTAQKGRAP